MKQALIQSDKQKAVLRNHKAFGDDTALKRGGMPKTQKELDEDTTEFLWANTPHVSDGRVALWVEDTDDTRLTTEAEKAAMISEEEAIADGFRAPGPEIIELSPINNATDVDGATDLVATFSSIISFGTAGAVHLYDGANVLISSMVIPTHVGEGGGGMFIYGNELRINPANTMRDGERYYILMDASTISGFPGISDKLAWNWKIAPAPITSRSATPRAKKAAPSARKTSRQPIRKETKLMRKTKKPEPKLPARKVSAKKAIKKTYRAKKK